MNNPFDAIEERLSKIENLLHDLKNKPNNSEIREKDELLTVPEAAKFLSLSVPTVYGLISKGQLPVMKTTKRCYFSKAELLEYLKTGRKKTKSETAKEVKAIVNKKKI